MEDIHGLALATIDQLNQHDRTPERSRHKLAMIRIAETLVAEDRHNRFPLLYAAVNLPAITLDAAIADITAACEWCEAA